MRLRISLLAVLLVGQTLLACTPASDIGVPSAELVASPAAFAARRNLFLDSLIVRGGTWWDIEAQRGLALLLRAKDTGDTTRVAEANRLLYDTSNKIDDGIVDAHVHHGGAFTFLRTYLLFRDRPDLLFPSTRDKLVDGRRHDGTVQAGESLLKYRDELFDRNTSLGLDLLDPALNPWRAGPGTENHKLQTIVTGMLLSEVYAGQSFRGRPVKDATPATDDFWHYFRDAFVRYSGDWGRSPETDHFRLDTSTTEKDSLGYFHVYLGDYWMVRDLHSDPVIRRHAEILIDRMLADYAEDAVYGLYTGYSGRLYQRNYVNGRSGWIMNYLLFDNLGFTPVAGTREALAHSSNWGSWLGLGIISGGYDPTNPEFPRALIDLARDKGDGYLVRDGRSPQANWVERDFALGFMMDGRGTHQHHAGGFYVQSGQFVGGLNVVPFYGAEPLPSGNKAVFDSDSVLARRVAITRTSGARFGSTALPNAKLWVSSERNSSGALVTTFDAVQQSGPWLFVKERADATGREVYLAVRPVSGSFRRLADVQDGQVYELTDADVATIWETSTSGEHTSFEAFMADVADNSLQVDGSWISYSSSRLGTTLDYDRVGHRAHRVDGAAVDWRAFEHGFSTPFTSNPHGTATATMSRHGYGASYDWDPDHDGNLDEMPSKVVDNLPGR